MVRLLQHRRDHVRRHSGYLPAATSVARIIRHGASCCMLTPPPRCRASASCSEGLRGVHRDGLARARYRLVRGMAHRGDRGDGPQPLSACSIDGSSTRSQTPRACRRGTRCDGYEERFLNPYVAAERLRRRDRRHRHPARSPRRARALSTKREHQPRAVTRTHRSEARGDTAHAAGGQTDPGHRDHQRVVARVPGRADRAGQERGGRAQLVRTGDEHHPPGRRRLPTGPRSSSST